MSGRYIEPTPFNGRPYYCTFCGMGYGEFMACEEPDCALESMAQAERRKLEHEKQGASNALPSKPSD